MWTNTRLAMIVGKNHIKSRQWIDHFFYIRAGPNFPCISRKIMAIYGIFCDYEHNILWSFIIFWGKHRRKVYYA